MTVLAIASFRSSPGTTTLATVFADVWPSSRRVLLVEADPAGGVLAVRMGLDAARGLLSLAAQSRMGLMPSEVWEHVSSVGFEVLPSPASPGAAANALELLGGVLPMALAELDADVLVDCGRLYAGSPALPFVTRADALVLAARPNAEELPVIPHALADLALTVPTRLVLVGETGVRRPAYSRAEVASKLGVEVAGSVAHDERAAAALKGEREQRWLARSLLVRDARRALDAVLSGGMWSSPEPGLSDEAVAG